MQLLILSAATEAELRAATERLVARLDEPLADVARELVGGAPLQRYRRMAVCRNAAEARLTLPWTPIAEAPPRPPRLVMLFPGDGSRDEIEAAADLIDVREEPSALFALERALAQLWRSWGVIPAETLGYGVGVEVAAGVAGAPPVGGPRVDFLADLWRLLADPDRVLLEVGPGRSLTQLLRKHPRARGRTLVASLGTPLWAPRASMLAALGALALAGVPVDWSAFHGAPL